MNKETQTGQIRHATLADLPALAQLARALIAQHQDYDRQRFDLPGTVSDCTAFFAERLTSEEAVILLAEQAGQVVGYAFVQMEAASFPDILRACAWLHDIYLTPAARGSGLGRALLQAAINAARALGSSALMLSVSPHNDSARSVFEQFGFRPTMIEMRLELPVVTAGTITADQT